MNIHPFIRTVIIIGIIFLITYAFADGVHYGSSWGIGMALGSMVSFAYVLHLLQKLQRFQREEEAEQY